jgi:hypothetical protein
MTDQMTGAMPNVVALQSLSDPEQLNAVRDYLQNKKRMGSLGVIAATANVAEGLLAEWCDDPAKVPAYEIVCAVVDVMSRSYPPRL